MVQDRRGRLTATDARARASLAAMGLDLHLNAHAAIEAFRADSAIDLSEATLPHWLRPEWIEPAVVRGERLGVVVVLPRPAMATVQSAPAAADFAIASVAHEVKQPLAAIELYAGARSPSPRGGHRGRPLQALDQLQSNRLPQVRVDLLLGRSAHERER